MPLSTMQGTRAAEGDGKLFRTGARGGTTLVVASGKGGVGKSLISIWLADSLAGRDRHILLYDAVPVLPGLHHLLAVPPAWNSGELLRAGPAPVHSLRRLSDGLWLLPGDADPEFLGSLAPDQRARLQRRIGELFRLFDVVVIDAGADPNSIVRSLTLGGDTLVVVTTPEPQSIRGCYRLIKLVATASPVRHVEVVVNRARSVAEGADAFDALHRTTLAVMGQPLRSLGVILEDPRVAEAVRGNPPGLERLRETEARRSLARQLGAQAGQEGTLPPRGGCQ